MPSPNHKPHVPGARDADLLRSMLPAGATLDEVLAAVHALSGKIDRLEALVSPLPSSLMLDPDEIARTMAQLRVARPISTGEPS